ncbi:hypothetical protein EVAR_52462_1 [Eumeta japonica]|uniref:Uncharacterized protein n=1 Tax=Eumeta variegata TaxID=151549 RepID=A0A4C1Z336_EUMVA|nr:hypothetical protein EVAR_52462_1 [Eumeta japonica]
MREALGRIQMRSLGTSNWSRYTHRDLAFWYTEFEPSKTKMKTECNFTCKSNDDDDVCGPKPGSLNNTPSTLVQTRRVLHASVVTDAVTTFVFSEILSEWFTLVYVGLFIALESGSAMHAVVHFVAIRKWGGKPAKIIVIGYLRTYGTFATTRTHTGPAAFTAAHHERIQTSVRYHATQLVRRRTSITY